MNAKEQIYRYSITMDGEEYQDENGPWIRYEDHESALAESAERVKTAEQEIVTLKHGVTDEILKGHLLGVEGLKAENKQLFKMNEALEVQLKQVEELKERVQADMNNLAEKARELLYENVNLKAKDSK